jgi:hypothetical protein
MKYWLLMLMAVGHFSYAGDEIDCSAPTSVVADVQACMISLYAKEQEGYEQSYAKLFQSENFQSYLLSNPDAFWRTIAQAKTSWEVSIELDCKVEELLNLKEGAFAAQSGYCSCLYRAHKQRIGYYKKLEKR